MKTILLLLTLNCGCPDLIVATPTYIELQSDCPIELTEIDWSSELFNNISALIHEYSGEYTIILTPESGVFGGLDDFTLHLNGKECNYSNLKVDKFTLEYDKVYQVFSIEGKYLGERLFNQLEKGIYIINKQIVKKL